MVRFLIVLVMLLQTALAGAAQTVLVFGDSLSAGFGLAPGESWPSLLDRRFSTEKRPYTVANASISGETTAGGRSRLTEALNRFKPGIVVLALGANDGLRGLPVTQMADNLTTMIRMAQKQKARVLLIGMVLPPNYGADYTARFEETFRNVARQEKVPLLPFLLEPIAIDTAAFQRDGLHPVAAAQPKILDHVWKGLRPLLK